MLIGLVAKEFINNDLDFNKNQIIKTAIEYNNKNIDFLCFGETFLQGFDAFTWKIDHDEKVALSKDSFVIKDLKQAAKENQVGLAFGYLEKVDKTFFSSYLIIDCDGKEIYNYRRYSSGWKEYIASDEFYKEGIEVGLFEYKNKKIVVGLCGDFWDNRFDYIKRVSETKKDFVLWPIYVNFSLSEWEKEVPQYALQSTYFGERVLMVNSISKEPRSHGGCFDFYNGRIMDQVPFDMEKVLIININ